MVLLGRSPDGVDAPAPSRPVQAAIAARRSIRAFMDRPVPREATWRLLEAAVQAPNHHRTNPWRFFVLDSAGEVRAAIADLAFEAALGRAANADDPSVRARAEGKRLEMVTTPLLVLAYAVPGRDEAQTRENYAAVACALQNLMLAATEEGLATGWSTGGICKHPRLAETVGADPAWAMVGAIYAGYAATVEAAPARPPASVFTTWLTPTG